jgi:hypothetical protein
MLHRLPMSCRRVKDKIRNRVKLPSLHRCHDRLFDTRAFGPHPRDRQLPRGRYYRPMVAKP